MTKKTFITHWNKLQKNMDWPEGLVQTLNPFIDMVFSNSELASKCDKLSADLFNDTWDVHGLINETAEEYGLDKELFTLFMCVHNSYFTKKKYIAHEWPMEVYYSSMSEIIVWAKTCYKRYGRWGLYEYGWVKISLKCGIFRLGRFQFTLGKYNKKDYNCAGVQIKKGCRMIDIHIPEGEPIPKEARMDAYKKAYKFFNQTGYAIFHCHSWLFFKAHREFLPPTSNIIDFMNDFNYVQYDEEHDYGDYWRIFGWPKEGEEVPQETALQKGYYKWISEHETMGGAAGVFIFDGENILKNDQD